MYHPRAVVTGGAGFLGSHLCEGLLAREEIGWEPRISVREGLATTIDWFAKELTIARTA